jgi:hypothetical protein
MKCGDLQALQSLPLGYVVKWQPQYSSSKRVLHHCGPIISLGLLLGRRSTHRLLGTNCWFESVTERLTLSVDDRGMAVPSPSLSQALTSPIWPAGNRTNDHGKPKDKPGEVYRFLSLLEAQVDFSTFASFQQTFSRPLFPTATPDTTAVCITRLLQRFPGNDFGL